MAETAATHAPPAKRWALRALYGVLVVATVALLLLVVGEIVYSFEDAHEHETHSHGFYGPIFDGAFFVFLPTALFTFVSGLAALVTGWIRRSPALRTYGALALGFCAVAVCVIVVEESLL
jgi:hypothetical protein